MDQDIVDLFGISIFNLALGAAIGVSFARSWRRREKDVSTGGASDKVGGA